MTPRWYIPCILKEKLEGTQWNIHADELPAADPQAALKEFPKKTYSNKNFIPIMAIPCDEVLHKEQKWSMNRHSFAFSQRIVMERLGFKLEADLFSFIDRLRETGSMGVTVRQPGPRKPVPKCPAESNTLYEKAPFNADDAWAATLAACGASQRR